MLKNLEETVNNVEKQGENRQKYRKTAKMSKIPQKCRKTEKTQSKISKNRQI